MSMPEAILFDAGNTLLFIDPRRVIPLLGVFGIQLSEEAFWHAELRARTGLTHTVQEGSNGTEPHVWAKYFDTLFRECGVGEEDLGPVGEALRNAHRKHHLWTWVDPDTPPALAALLDQGFRLGVISNADGRIEGLVESGGIRPFFEFVMDSAKEGVEKPDPEIFHRAARRMSLEPEEVLYVGDLYPVDVLGAQAAGLEAILLDPLGELEHPVPRIPRVAALPEYLRRVSPRP